MILLKSLPLLLLLNFVVEIQSQNASRSCIRCLCHAVSACYSLPKCAQYSITLRYWREGGSVVVPSDDRSNETLSYQYCMQDDTCITDTIFNYTTRLGHVDCNCDQEFNCVDMLAVHYNLCHNMQTIPALNLRRQRYRDCSGIPMDLPYRYCQGERLEE